MIVKGFNTNEISLFLSELEKEIFIEKYTPKELNNLNRDTREFNTGSLEHIAYDFEANLSQLFDEMKVDVSKNYSIHKIPEIEKKYLMDLIDATFPFGHHQEDVSYRIDFLVVNSDNDVSNFAGELFISSPEREKEIRKIYVGFETLAELSVFIKKNGSCFIDNQIYKSVGMYFVEICSKSIPDGLLKSIKDEKAKIVPYLSPIDQKRICSVNSIKNIRIVK